jgi:transposase-like protein
MPASRRYTEQQKTEALNLYREHGPHEAARRTNIPVTTISAWAYRSGTRTDAPQRTRAAVEAAKANADARRQQLRQEILDSAIEAAQRIREPYKTHVGQQGKEVILTRPPADMVRNLMTAAAIGWDKETVAAGGVSDRKGHVIGEGFSLDAELESFTRGAAAAAGSPGSVAEHSPNGTAPAG